MRYLSVCSGIEAASVAWAKLGWRAVGFAEIEPFASAVLKHRFPTIPNFGDFTQIGPEDVGGFGAVDLLVGGTPCQSFSIAGLRLGMDDPRGNLAIEFLRLAKRIGTRWILFENVPGLLSSGEGRDFGAFLGLLGECGYGWTYRILDAQFFGVPQRRRRVFVVGHLGDWRPAAAVLFEPDCLSGHPAPSRGAGQSVAGTFKACASSGGWSNSADHAAAGYMTVAKAIHATTGSSIKGADHDTYIAHYQDSEFGCKEYDTASIRAGRRTDHSLIAHSLRGDGFDASEDGTGRGTPLVAFQSKASADNSMNPSEIAPSLDTGKAGGTAIVLRMREGCEGGGKGPLIGEDMSFTLGAMTNDQAVCIRTGGDYDDPTMSIDDKAFLAANPMSDRQMAVHNGQSNSQVRRLTPRECERLQGFPDDWTLVPYRGKPAADGPRYRALGNSMAVPVMRWIGERIEFVRALTPAPQETTG